MELGGTEDLSQQVTIGLKVQSPRHLLITINNHNSNQSNSLDMYIKINYGDWDRAQLILNLFCKQKDLNWFPESM